MKAPLLFDQVNGYHANFMFDDAPRGFEDHLDESILLRNLNRGSAFAEYGRPFTTHLQSRPPQAAARYMTIDERQICGHLTTSQIYGPNMALDGIRIMFRPMGPYKETAIQCITDHPGEMGLEFRMIFSNNEEDELTVTHIITADLIQL